MKRMSGPDLFIDSDRALAELLSRTTAEPLLALDTEFVREKTYYPGLCLIQLATPELSACIDCLSAADLSPLFDRLFAEDCTWVLHSARQDLEVLHLADPRPPHRLIDTQTAAALLGHAPQIGLQDLLAEELGVELDKGHTRTDWAQRPLPEAALEYAFDDVRHLLPLWRKLEQRLDGLERSAWFESDCVGALSIPPLTPPLTLWKRLRGLGSMSPRQQTGALALVEWRESHAQSLDRPRRWIMGDDLLLRIARELPRTFDALKSIPEMPKRLADRSGREILAALSRGGGELESGLDDINLPQDRPSKALLQALQKRVRARAGELGIESEVLATRKEMSEILVGRASERIEGGWRWYELEKLMIDEV